MGYYKNKIESINYDLQQIKDKVLMILQRKEISQESNRELLDILLIIEKMVK